MNALTRLWAAIAILADSLTRLSGIVDRAADDLERAMLTAPRQQTVLAGPAEVNLQDLLGTAATANGHAEGTSNGTTATATKRKSKSE